MVENFLFFQNQIHNENSKFLVNISLFQSKIFPPLDSIGYSQIKSYLKKEINYNLMREKIIIKTRQFAKKQEKWFDKEPINLTVDMGHMNSQLISNILYCLMKDIT